MSQKSPGQRQVICFALDTSLSMMNENIRCLNEGLSNFFKQVNLNHNARLMTDVAVVTFGDGVRVVAEFGPIADRICPPLIAAGATPLGEAVERSVALIESNRTGLPQNPAILVIASDGRATDNTMKAIARCNKLSQENALIVYPVAIGSQADRSVLTQLADGNPVKETSATEIGKIFRELAEMLVMASAPASVFDKPAVPWNVAMQTSCP